MTTPHESNPAATKAPSSASSSGDQGSSSRPSLASAGSTNPTPPEVGLAVGGGPSRDPVREALIEWETFAMKTIYGLEPGDPLRQGMERLHGPRLARTRAALSQARTNTNEKAGGDCGKAGGEGSLIGVVPTHRASSSPGVSASVDAPITADVVTPPATFTAAELLREVVDAVLDGETTSTYMNEDDWLDEGFRRLARALTAAREYLDKAESQSNASRDVGSVSTSASSCDSAASLLATDPTFRQCCSPGSEYRAATRAVAILKPGRAAEILREVVDEVDSLLSVTPDPPALKAARAFLEEDKAAALEGQITHDTRADRPSDSAAAPSPPAAAPTVEERMPSEAEVAQVARELHDLWDRANRTDYRSVIEWNDLAEMAREPWMAVARRALCLRATTQELEHVKQIIDGHWLHSSIVARRRIREVDGLVLDNARAELTRLRTPSTQNESALPFAADYPATVAKRLRNRAAALRSEIASLARDFTPAKHAAHYDEAARVIEALSLSSNGGTR